jgi:hypothetical protein
MARTVAKIARFGDLSTHINNKLVSHSAFGNLANPAGRAIDNVANGQPLTGRSLLDPAGAVLMKPPGPPPPPPTFPDVEGAALAMRRNVRRRGASGGVGSTVLTGGYSPTGQAAGSLGGS